MPQTLHQNTDAIRVTYDHAKGRFEIRCPVWRNDCVRALPNRRWQKTANCWAVPAIRANVEALKNLRGTVRGVSCSPEAVDRLDNYCAERNGSRRVSAFPTFYGFKREPRPKQMEALKKIYGLRAFALFMDMRTGKTKVFIDAACALRMEDKINRVLLICPLSIRRNWLREFTKDAPIPIDAYLLDTSKPKEFDRWLASPSDFKWLLVGVESLAAGRAIEFAKRFACSSTKVLCGVDESSKIKTHNATRSQNAVELGRMTEYRGILTGTPLTKNPMDLFMQYEFLDPDIIGIGDYYSFRARYAVMGGYEKREIIGYENLDELVGLVTPYTFQVRKHEVMQHEKTYVVREVHMGTEQAKLYSELRRKSRIGDLFGDNHSLIVQNVLEKMLRLQELAGGFVSYQYSEEELLAMAERLGSAKKLPRTYRQPVPGKNPKIEDLLAATEEYDGKTIIWCAFKDEIYAVRDALRVKYGREAVTEIHGDMDEAERDIAVNVRFQNDPGVRFIVGNAATGGMGLTMDAAENIFFYSNTHNYVDREQAEERGTADGKSTLVVDFVCAGTVDNVILASNEAKKDLAEYIRGLIGDTRRQMDMAAALDKLLSA